jgi:hypothetical protein
MASSFSYTVFRYVKDAQRDFTIPVGLALWSDDAKFVQVRLVRAEDKVSHLSKIDDLPYIELSSRKLAHWIAEGALPHQRSQLSPYADNWWRHVRDLLIHRVRASEPLPVDCKDPNAEIEPLFRSIVRPEIAEDGQVRIDSALGRALGQGLANRFRRGVVAGFAGKPVHLMKVLEGELGDVVIDAVNLTLSDASDRADEVVGKLHRARLNGHGLSPKSRELVAIVGYLASPEGLNGEAYLKEWIEQGGNAQTFDLRKDAEHLRAAVQAGIDRVRAKDLAIESRSD